MTKKIFYFLFVIFNIFALIYLVYPLPSLPDLPNSVKSNLPGDTVQISHVTAYYTNMSRTEVMNFYKAYYTGLFRINLNHPPEKAKQVIVDTIPSYYLEEIVLPLKESLYRVIMRIFGLSGLPVFQAGHWLWQRPHSVQVPKSSRPFQVKSSILPTPMRSSSPGSSKSTFLPLE